jgi:hypothetical protein
MACCNLIDSVAHTVSDAQRSDYAHACIWGSTKVLLTQTAFPLVPHESLVSCSNAALLLLQHWQEILTCVGGPVGAVQLDHP